MLPSVPVRPRPPSATLAPGEPATEQAAILSRLRRLEGQVRGIERMVVADASYLDILTQLAAISAAARAIGLLVLEDYLRACVARTSSQAPEALIAEVTGAVERFCRALD